MSRLRLRIGSIAAVVLLFGFYAVANFVPDEQRVASPLLPDGGLRLGLDLQGGIHWVLGVKLDVAVEQELDFLRDNLEGQLGDEGVTGLELDVSDGRLLVTDGTAADAVRMRELASDTGVLRPVGTSPVASSLSSATPGSRRCARAGWARCSRSSAAASATPSGESPTRS